MRYPHSAFYLLALSFLVMPSVGHAAEEKCTAKLAKEALSSGPVIGDWHDMYAVFQKYGACDDGALAEGFSDKVVGLLANHWDKLNELNDIVAQDKSFEDFVLRHLDQLMSPVEFSKIVDAASNSCPSYGKVLCADILRRTKELAAEP